MSTAGSFISNYEEQNECPGTALIWQLGQWSALNPNSCVAFRVHVRNMGLFMIIKSQLFCCFHMVWIKKKTALGRPLLGLILRQSVSRLVVGVV